MEIGQAVLKATALPHSLRLYIVLCVLAVSGSMLSPGCEHPPSASEAGSGGETDAAALVRDAEVLMWQVDGAANLVLRGERLMELQAAPPPDLKNAEELRASLARATVLLKRALEIDPDLHLARLYLAAVHLRAQTPLEAVKWAESYHEAEPDDDLAEIMLCTAYMAAEDWDALIRFCGQLLAQEGGGEREDLAQLMAIAWQKKGEVEKAREWANRAIAMNPEALQSYYVLGAIQYLSKDEAGLEETRLKLREIGPTAEEGLTNLLKSMDEGKQPSVLKGPI